MPRRIACSIVLLVACGRAGDDPAGGDTDPEQVAVCGEHWSEACTIVDGLCHDPLATGLTTELPPARLDAHVADWTSSDVCGPLAVIACDEASFALAEWGDSENPTSDVFDLATGAWLGGFHLTDEDVGDVCGTTVWMGDDAHLACAQEALDWVEARGWSRCNPLPDGGPCDAAACVRDDRTAG